MKKLSCLLVVAALAAIASPASAALYTVSLTNGSTFETRYAPQRSSWDPELILILGDKGNWIGLPAAEVAKVAEKRLFSGYARRLDAATIEVGYTANDADGDGQNDVTGAQIQQVLGGAEGAEGFGSIPYSGGYFTGGGLGDVQGVNPSDLGAGGGGIPLSAIDTFGDGVQ